MASLKRTREEIGDDLLPNVEEGKKQKIEEDLPSFPLLFTGSYEDDDFEHPRSLFELSLMNLSGSIREKPNWTKKIYDEEITKKWNEEARQNGFEQSAWDFILAELKFYASKTGSDEITLSSVEGVYQRDLPDKIQEKLLKGIKVLEDVPDDEKDWHPGSNNQVLDLVHPSLYCYVNGVTPVSDDKLGGNPELWKNWLGTGFYSYRTVDNSHEESNDSFARGGYFGGFKKRFYVSENYQWIPADIRVSPSGSVKFTSYINNLHPDIHKELYSTLEETLELFIPLWNLVLTDTLFPGEPRILPSGAWYEDAVDPLEPAGPGEDMDEEEEEEEEEEGKEEGEGEGEGEGDGKQMDAEGELLKAEEASNSDDAEEPMKEDKEG